MNLRIFISILFLGFLSCNTEWDTALYIQKIKGSSKVLYKYDAWGGRDTHVFGYILQDSTEKFKVDIQENLPFTYLEKVPVKGHIVGVEFENAYLTNDKIKESKYKPIEISVIKKEGFRIKTKLYQYNGFMKRSGGLKQYEFENFKETQDSLTFYGLKRVNIALSQPELLDSLKFKKTNVRIYNNGQPEIIRIVINDLKIDKTDNEIISNITYYLIPKNTLKTNKFSDYGIFKQIK